MKNAMHFEKTSKISHPASAVLDTMIERMEAIVPFLPNIESIETQKKQKLRDGRVRIERRWQGTSDSAPAAVRPFLSRDLMAWIDRALWTPADYKVEWAHSTCSSGVARLYGCSGVNFFGPDPDDPENATRIRITGDLTVYPDQLPGVPGFIASRLAPQVEKFIIELIAPNLTDVASGLQRYLDREGGSGTRRTARKRGTR
jgi:hypothetical protein